MNVQSQKTLDKTADQPDDNPVRRQAMAHVHRQRLVIFWAAIAVTSCAVFMNIVHKRDMRVRGFTDIAAVLLWMMMFRLGTRLRSISGVEPSVKAKDDEADKRLKSWRPPSI